MKPLTKIPIRVVWDMHHAMWRIEQYIGGIWQNNIGIMYHTKGVSMKAAKQFVQQNPDVYKLV
jgi:hypothetical protein